MSNTMELLQTNFPASFLLLVAFAVVVAAVILFSTVTFKD